MAASLENLSRYQDEGESLLESIIMGDETVVYKFTPQSKRISMTWKHSHSPSTNKNSKLSHLRKKQWQLCSGIVKASCCVNFFHQKTTINSDKYFKTLEKFHEAIKRKRPGPLE
jgi:hypothetical protein